jgi:hypothetical protein
MPGLFFGVMRHPRPNEPRTYRNNSPISELTLSLDEGDPARLRRHRPARATLREDRAAIVQFPSVVAVARHRAFGDIPDRHSDDAPTTASILEL